MQGKRRSIILILIISLSVVTSLNADSDSLWTEINGVNNGVSGFGLGLFPLGTDFEYLANFDMIPGYRHRALFSLDLSFGFGHVTLSGYDHQTGRPSWIDPSIEDAFDGQRYFRIWSQAVVFLQQGFGTNPVAGTGPLVELRLSFRSRVSNASEALSVSSDPSSSVFNKPPFDDGSFEHFPAYPWLEGDRFNWNNSISFSTYWYMRRTTTRTSNYDGVYMDVTLETGPWWLGNDIWPDVVTSDYVKLSWSLTEYLTAYVSERDNGWNWVNMSFGHTNTAGYIWGDVVPEYQIQTDRLRGYLTDRLWIRFTGPQFIATDCYPYIEVSLNNNFYFGGVQNEVDASTWAMELKSSVTFEFHLRLFGFIHVRYRFGYDFIKGFLPDVPSWWQDGQLGFYVSL